MSGFPILAEKPAPFPGEPAAESGAKREDADAGLWSAQAVIGYQIQTGDEIVGHVIDFAVDDKSWAIGHLARQHGIPVVGQQGAGIAGSN